MDSFDKWIVFGVFPLLSIWLGCAIYICVDRVMTEDPLTLSGGEKTPRDAYISLLSDDGMWNSSGVVFQAKGETILTFTADGKIIPNPKYPPDENAKRFIEAVQRTWPKMCGKKEVRG